VVRDEQHVRAQVGAGGDEPRLRGAAHVAREEHAAAARLHADHERAIVARRRPDARQRPERRDAQVAEHRRSVPRAALEDRRARTPRRLAEGSEVRIRAAAPGQPHGSDGQATEDGREPAAVVEIRVARDHEVQALHAEGCERGRHDRAAEVEAARERRAAVHEDRALPPLHQHRVARAHVEDHETRRLRPERRRGGDAQDRHRREGRRDAERRAAHGEPRESHEGRAREHEGPRRWREGRRGQGARQPGQRGEGPVRGRQGHGERGVEQPRRPPRAQGGGEGERQHDPARPRHRHHVHREGQGRHDPEVERGQGSRREDRARRRRNERREPLPHAEPRRGAPRPRPRREHERRAGREGELGARLEERLRLPRQDHERRQGQGMTAPGRPGPRHGRRAREHDHEGAAHGHVEARQERVGHRERRSEAERRGAHVVAGRERGTTHQDPPRDREDQCGEHREVQPRDREEVRDAERREGVARLRSEARALAEGERREERSPLAVRLEAARGARAQPVEPRQGTPRLAVHDACREPVVDESRLRPDPGARQPARLAPAPGIVPVPGSAQPDAHAHAVPGQRALERSDTRRCRSPDHVHARGDPGSAGSDRLHALELDPERAAPPQHRPHRALEGLLALRLRPRRGRVLELPGEPRAPGAQRREQERERPHPRPASRRPGEREERGPGGDRRGRGKRRAVGGDDAEGEREREAGETGQDAAAGDRGRERLTEGRGGS
jgi:hypothetical protein